VKRKSKLIDLIERAYEEEQAFVASLSDAEQSAVGEADNWSAKDVVAHLAAWKERVAQSLAAAARGESPPGFDDIDRVNAEDFETYRAHSWSDILAKSERAHKSLLERVEAMSEDDLADTQTLSWQNGRPPWRLMVGNGYSHPISHLAQLYVERGETCHATEMQEEAAGLLGELDESPSWQGIVRYNLACHYALSGQKERAISGLREALTLNPDLTEWSKQDPDFVPLRQEAGYQALYSE
jgi:hypothetical protein